MPAVKKPLPGLVNAAKLGDDLLRGPGLVRPTVSSGLVALERCTSDEFPKRALNLDHPQVLAEDLVALRS
jgi:hypothetical protein